MEGEWDSEQREIELCLRDEQGGRMENRECSKQEGMSYANLRKECVLCWGVSDMNC